MFHPPYCLRQDLSLAWRLPIRLDRLAIVPWGLPVSPSPAPGTTGEQQQSWLLCVDSGSWTPVSLIAQWGLRQLCSLPSPSYSSLSLSFLVYCKKERELLCPFHRYGSMILYPKAFCDLAGRLCSCDVSRQELGFWVSINSSMACCQWNVKIWRKKPTTIDVYCLLGYPQPQANSLKYPQ